MARFLRIAVWLTCLLSALVACTLLTAQIFCTIADRSLTLAVGRQYHSLELDINGHEADASLWNFTQPLMKIRRGAPFLRTQRYGWFVGETRISGFEGNGFRISKEEIDDEWRPELLMVTYTVRAPVWAFELVAALPAMLGVILLLWRRARRSSNQLK